LRHDRRDTQPNKQGCASRWSIFVDWLVAVVSFKNIWPKLAYLFSFTFGAGITHENAMAIMQGFWVFTAAAWALL
jgi:hypothetical protein